MLKVLCIFANMSLEADKFNNFSMSKNWFVLPIMCY